MKCLSAVILILYLYQGLALEENCDCYIRYKHNVSGEANIRFYKNVEKDSVYSYVIGFTFSKHVNKIEVYGNRSSIRVNDTLWFVSLQNSYRLKLVDFEMLIRYGLWNEIDRVTFNGETICEKTQRVSGHVNNSDKIISTLTLSSINLVISTALAGLIILMLLKISTLRTLTDKHWQEAINQVVDIQRRLSPNNPNNVGIPLPKVPGSCDSKRATYIDLMTYQRCSGKFPKKKNRFLNRFKDDTPSSLKKDFKFLEGNPSRENVYVLQEANREKQGTL